MSAASCTIAYEEQSDFNISKRMKQKEQHGEIFKIAPFSLLSHTFALCLYKRGDAISLLPSANGSPNLTQAQSKEARMNKDRAPVRCVTSCSHILLKTREYDGSEIGVIFEHGEQTTVIDPVEEVRTYLERKS